MKQWFHSHEKAVYRIVNAGLLICMVLFGAERFLGIGELSGEHFIVALIVLGILAAGNYMTMRGRILSLFVLLLLLCAGTASGAAGGPAFWKSFFLWLVGKDAAPRKWITGYGLLQTALFAAGCYLAEIFFEKMPAVKTGAAVFLLGVLVFCLLSRQELNQSGIAFILCFLLLTWEEWVQKHWGKKRVKESGFQAHTFWILPFLSLYLVLLLVMPAPEEPYDWMWVKTVYRQLKESFHTYTQNIKWGNREGFGMAFTGFSREGALGGDLREDAREIMRVQVRPSSMEYLYLTGTVYDTFDGRGWSQTRQSDINTVFMDTAQTLYAVKAYDRHYRTDYLKEMKVSIRYEDFSTGYVFAPLKVWDFEEGDSGSGARKSGQEVSLDDICGDGTLRWDGQKGYGTEYEIRYYRMNAGQPQFDLFLEEAGKTEGVNEPVWAEIMRECEGYNGQTFTFQDREDYRKTVYELYLGAADLGEEDLSEEVGNYLGEILEDAETDVEKLSALESALSRLTYTLTPGELPESVKDAGDFLDYFLLESRQGYCTYFATAFVLLARAEGIPARYVQGYCVPIGEQGEAAVYSNMAHAWPEAYLEGVGWIPFEPTPGYGSRRYDSWKLQQTAGSVSADEDAPEEAGPGSDPGTGVTEDVGKADQAEEADPGTEIAPGFSWGMSGYTALAVLLVCWILLMFENALGKYRYGKMNPEKRLKLEVYQNLRVLSCFGLEREEWETLEEFRGRAVHLLGRYENGGAGLPDRSEEGKAVHLPGRFEKGKAVHLPERYGEERELSIRFMEDYERVVYGGQPAGEDMIKETMKEREGLLELLKRERRWVWFYCRIRLYLRRYRG